MIRKKKRINYSYKLTTPLCKIKYIQLVHFSFLTSYKKQNTNKNIHLTFDKVSEQKLDNLQNYHIKNPVKGQ